jgi:hypothetical protein
VSRNIIENRERAGTKSKIGKEGRDIIENRERGQGHNRK